MAEDRIPDAAIVEEIREQITVLRARLKGKRQDPMVCVDATTAERLCDDLTVLLNLEAAVRKHPMAEEAFRPILTNLDEVRNA